jgi:hypothetical protein
VPAMLVPVMYRTPLPLHWQASQASSPGLGCCCNNTLPSANLPAQGGLFEPCCHSLLCITSFIFPSTRSNRFIARTLFNVLGGLLACSLKLNLAVSTLKSGLGRRLQP